MVSVKKLPFKEFSRKSAKIDWIDGLIYDEAKHNNVSYLQ
jgi:hypothetical protein